MQFKILAEKGISVIFLRYDSRDLVKITDSLIKVLNDYGSSLYGKFVVITVNKIRIREILQGAEIRACCCIHKTAYT